jgi:para-aminobenzoate N-oxygenase AurF
MARTVQIADPERTASRLLKASVQHSYDPAVDIDWEAPLAEGMYFLPPERSTLYGTQLWDQLSQAQRIELTKHEVASIASVGLWFELILMQFLVREIYDQDPLTRHAQYGLTEIGDETRHSIMFARMIEKFGCPAYGPGPLRHQRGRLFKAGFGGASFWAAILVAEETLDMLQRETMQDERVQPLVRMVNRIHVVEEARHVRYAREEVARRMRGLSGAAKEYHKTMFGFAALQIVGALVNPKVYAAVGIDPAHGRAVARANPNWQATMRWSGSRLMPYLREVGLVGGGPGEKFLRRGFLI